MTAQGKHSGSASRVEALLRTPNAAPWSEAPTGLHDRVMASLDTAPALQARTDSGLSFTFRALAMAASVAIIAGGLGLFAGAAAWRNVPTTAPMVTAASNASTGTSPTVSKPEAPTVVLARAFDDLKPAGSSRLMASMAAPMRSEAEGLAAETRLAARTVLSRLPFVSME